MRVASRLGKKPSPGVGSRGEPLRTLTSPAGAVIDVLEETFQKWGNTTRVRGRVAYAPQVSRFREGQFVVLHFPGIR